MSDAPRKSVWIPLAIGAAVLLVLAAFVLGIVFWWTGGRLARRIAAIRAAGDPASIADLDPGPIPADDNAAVVLASLSGQLDAFGRDHATFYDSPPGRAYEKADSDGQPLTGDQLAALRAILDQHAPLTKGLTMAAACADYVPVGEFSLNSSSFLDVQLKRSGQLRTASRYLLWQMEVLAAEGHADQAVERGIDLLKLARLAEHEPMSVSYLITIALRSGANGRLYDALAAGPIPPELHAALDAELALMERPGRFSHAVRTERAFSISAFDAMTGTGNAITARLARVVMSGQIEGVLDYYDAVLPVADEPWFVKRAQVSINGPTAPTRFGALAASLVPAFQAAYEAHNRDLAVQRSLRIFNALRQFAETHGREAKELADLKLPAAATTDPFDGQSLKLKLTPEGWIVYSVFKNGVDDDGDFKQQKDCGVAPRQHRAD